MVNNKNVPSLLAKQEIEKMPILGTAMQGLQCIFVDRNDRKNKDGVLNKIRERCDLIKQKKNYPPILLYPEGTTANGKYILSFKKGAFASFNPIKIFALKIHERNVSPYLCDNITILEHILLSFCNLYQNFEVLEFETYYPDHLQLQNEEDWQIYSDKINNIMAKALKVPQSQSGFRHVSQYRNLVNKKIQELESKNNNINNLDIENQNLKQQIDNEKTPFFNNKDKDSDLYYVKNNNLTPNVEGGETYENSNKYGSIN